MKSTVEQLSPTRVRLNVEVPFEELKPDFERTYKSLTQQIRIPGFRPGKAPKQLIEARVGRGAVLQQVINDALPSRYSEAVAQAEIKPISQPEIELDELKDGESFSFSAAVEVAPEITLPDFSTIKVEVDPITISDDDVDKQLDALRARFGTLVPKDKKIKSGDFVSIDLSATVDGEEVPDASTTGLSHEVGSDELIDGLDDALIGLKAGKSATFTTTLVAGEHAGKEAEVTVTVESVKKRELPDADDDFAQMASEFDTIDELKADLAKQVERSSKMTQASQISDAVRDKLLDTVEVALPEKLAEEQANAQISQITDQVGDQIGALLEAQGTDREKWEAEIREETAKSIRTELLLDAIADKLETTVEQDELMQTIMVQAQRYGMQPQEFIQQIQQANQLGALYAEVRRNKALAAVIVEASVTDADGNVVDTKDFFEPSDEVEGESAESGEE